MAKKATSRTKKQGASNTVRFPTNSPVPAPEDCGTCPACTLRDILEQAEMLQWYALHSAQDPEFAEHVADMFPTVSGVLDGDEGEEAAALSLGFNAGLLAALRLVRPLLFPVTDDETAEWEDAVYAFPDTDMCACMGHCEASSGWH